MLFNNSETVRKIKVLAEVLALVSMDLNRKAGINEQ